MLGDIVELTVVVRDLDAAIERYTGLFGLKVHHRAESKEFGFKNAILPTGTGHIELLQPTDPDKAVGRFLAMTSRKMPRMRSSPESPKPRRSRSRVPRLVCGSQVVSSIAPLRTKRSACGL